jgi:purine-cytosine permease-like protein
MEDQHNPGGSTGHPLEEFSGATAEVSSSSPPLSHPTDLAEVPQDSIEADYTETVVPLSARRSNFRMFLTFGSMQLVFGAVLVGYDARFQGLTLGRLIFAMAIAATAMTIYCIGSANVGAIVGQTHSVATRGIFGWIGSAIVSILLVIDGMGFYLFTVLFVMTLFQALFGTFPAMSLFTALLAFVMIFNNYFGFTGLQRFAQYVAVPIVALWALYAVIRSFTSVSGHVLATVPALPHGTSPSSTLFVAGAMIGLSTWGNEPDIFRYAKQGRASAWNIPQLAIPYYLGAFLFPIMGYLVASLANNSDFSASIRYFAHFTLFGVAFLMMVVLLVNQWAVQDGNLYIAINGAQNLLSRIPRWRRQYTVVGLGLIAAGLTYVLPNLTKTFNIVTGIGAVTVPVASTIMAMEIFVLPRLFGIKRPLHRVATWGELALGNWPAIVALLAGTAVGAITGGLIPGTSGFQHTYVGSPPIQAWVTGAVVYLVLVAIVSKTHNVKQILGFSKVEELPESSIALAVSD